MSWPSGHRRSVIATVAAVSLGIAGVGAPLLSATPPAHGQDIDCVIPAPSAPPVPTRQQQEYRTALHELATGAGVRVAVIDTGISEHPELGMVHDGPDFVNPLSPTSRQDCDMHGTAVAGIIAGRSTGLAPDAELISIRQSSAHFRHRPAPDPQLGADPYDPEDPNAPAAGSLRTLAAAIEAAIDAGADIINISIVSCSEAEITVPELEAAVARAEATNITIVAASGNSGPHCDPTMVAYPAHLATVISVGALADPYSVAEFSLPADVVAPGVIPVSLSSTGHWTAGLSGTSFAAPVVSGTIALLIEQARRAAAHPHAQPLPSPLQLAEHNRPRPADIRAALHDHAQPLYGDFTADAVVDPLHLLSAVAPTTDPPVRKLVVEIPPQPPVYNQGPRLIASLAAGALLLAAAAAWRRPTAGRNRPTATASTRS